MNSIINPLRYYRRGKAFFHNPSFVKALELTKAEGEKSGSRTAVINFLLSTLSGNPRYLEIGVRDPKDNFDQVQCADKLSVDPGYELKENQASFKMTSDQFFEGLRNKSIGNPDQKWDLIFIDGLHLAEQVDRDISNSLDFLKDHGFLVIHDCNPPTEWHARECFSFPHSPAQAAWNGTTWKGFLKYRQVNHLYSCCVDTDWGVGIISKSKKIGDSLAPVNPFYEFSEFDRHRKNWMNLLSFEEFKSLFGGKN